MTAIILLNWNGAGDTVACLNTLMQAKGDFIVVVADNGSTDDSVTRLKEYAAVHTEKLIHILTLGQNYGFAAGNNKAIQYCASLRPDSYLLLNNDTEVEPDFLTALVSFSTSHPEYRILTSRIHYFYDKNRIWLCGGDISFGSRRRNYFDAELSEHLSEIVETEYLPITFVSGCCLFFYPELLDSNNELLSNRFFFGEEDYEFSLRMEKCGVRMACVMQSVIYHKVGASKDKIADSLNVGKDYSFYLGKLIGCRLHYPRLKFAVMLIMMFFKITANFKRKGVAFVRSICLSGKLIRDAVCKEAITGDDFRSFMSMN